jgi:hypothetical protein
MAGVRADTCPAHVSIGAAGAAMARSQSSLLRISHLLHPQPSPISTGTLSRVDMLEEVENRPVVPTLDSSNVGDSGIFSKPAVNSKRGVRKGPVSG